MPSAMLVYPERSIRAMFTEILGLESYTIHRADGVAEASEHLRACPSRSW